MFNVDNDYKKLDAYKGDITNEPKGKNKWS